MSKEQKQHFWIPDTEVKSIGKKLRGQTKPQNVVFSEHGEKLSRGLQSIRETLEKNKADDSLINTDTRVFKVKLCDDEKIQSKEDLFRNTGLTLNAVQNKTDAVVSSTKQQLENLQKKVGTYTRNGEDKTYFDYIELAPYSRIGPGFSGGIKPDISAYGGDIINNSGTPMVPLDTGSAVLHKDGFITVDAGTSFTAPVVSGDIAEIMGMLPIKNVLLAKALLFHTALPVWDTDTSSPEEISGYHMLYGRGISNSEEALYSTESKVTFLRTGSISRTKKERINIYMPELLAAQSGLDIARVTTTCVSSPFVDRTKGSEYLDAYIRTSLKKATSKTGLSPAPVEQKDIHKEWHTCYQTSNIFSRFKPGDWQVWLEAFGRWNKKDDDIPYALVVTIEDLSGTLDIYNEIQAQNRYQLLNEIRIPVENQNK
ncbi:MAG: S8 family serine peptidase [Treponema sp.]